MGNAFVKKDNHLFHSLMKNDIEDKISYLDQKLDRLDDKIHVLDQHTKANLIVISNDIHLLYDRIPPPKS